MKNTAIASAVLAAFMLTGTVAIAQRDEPLPILTRPDQGQRNETRDRTNNYQRPDYRGNNRDNRDNGRSYDKPQRFDRGERGVGPDHAYHRGDRMPPQYRTRQYIVEDWRGHHLSEPPRGYQWVQSGGDYVLVAITTGIILQLLLNN